MKTSFSSRMKIAKLSIWWTHLRLRLYPTKAKMSIEREDVDKGIYSVHKRKKEKKGCAHPNEPTTTSLSGRRMRCIAFCEKNYTSLLEQLESGVNFVFCPRCPGIVRVCISTVALPPFIVGRNLNRRNRLFVIAGC